MGSRGVSGASKSSQEVLVAASCEILGALRGDLGAVIPARAVSSRKSRPDLAA